VTSTALLAFGNEVMKKVTDNEADKSDEEDQDYERHAYCPEKKFNTGNVRILNDYYQKQHSKYKNNDLLWFHIESPPSYSYRTLLLHQ
jgi:hypothetical protein